MLSRGIAVRATAGAALGRDGMKGNDGVALPPVPFGGFPSDIGRHVLLLSVKREGAGVHLRGICGEELVQFRLLEAEKASQP